jgi:hypothetical protein
MAIPFFIKKKRSSSNKAIPLLVLRKASNESFRINHELSWDGWVILVCTVIATIFTVAGYLESRQGQPLIKITISLFNIH